MGKFKVLGRDNNNLVFADFKISLYMKWYIDTGGNEVIKERSLKR